MGHKYNYYSNKRDEDEKKINRFGVVGLGIGILIGILSGSVLLGILSGLIGLFGGGILGWIFTLFD